jgi:hypothetical protein
VIILRERGDAVADLPAQHLVGEAALLDARAPQVGQYLGEQRLRREHAQATW